MTHTPNTNAGPDDKDLTIAYMAGYHKGKTDAQPKAEPEPKCVVIVEVFGKDWRLEYMSLPVGRHKLYPQQFTYTHPAPKAEPLTAEQYTALAHRMCSRYRHDSHPSYIEYTFQAHTLEQFVRAIEAARHA